MIRIVLAVSGGIVAGVAVAVIEGSIGTPSFVQLIAVMGAVALILLLTGTSWHRNAEDTPAELLQQLDHHRRELYRLQARYQRKGVLTPAEVSAWFRNKRTVDSVKKQLHNTETPYQPDAIDTAPPLAPVGLFTRAKEYVRQPAVSVFIILFLVSVVLAYPLSAAAQFVFRDYLATASPFTRPAEPDTAPVVTEVTATNTLQPDTNTSAPGQTEPASSSTLTPTSQPTTTPTIEPPPKPTNEPTTEPTNQPTTTPTAEPTSTSTPTPSATPTQPSTLTSTSSPPGTPVPTLPPAPTATATFLPVGTLPPACGEGTWEVEPNDTFETAQGPLAAGATICGYLDDAFDFYYVEVPAPGRLTVTLQNVEIEPGTPPLNLLKLFTAGTAPIDWCCLDRRNRIELTIAVNVSRYYILVDTREIVGLPYVLAVGYEAGGS